MAKAASVKKGLEYVHIFKVIIFIHIVRSILHLK
jgi:hypothetical protein